jgi:hypothetical protein
VFVLRNTKKENAMDSRLLSIYCSGVKRLLVVIAVSMALVLLGGVLFVRHISKPRVVGRAMAPDGTEMCVVQQCNWDAEPFTTSFVYRRPGGPWGWFYFDHQDLYWGKSRVSLDTNKGVAVFYRGNSPAVTFAWATETYTMHRWARTMTGAQWQLPPNWNPGLSVNAQ